MAKKDDQEALDLLESILEPPAMVSDFNVEKGTCVQRPPTAEEAEVYRADADRIVKELVELREAEDEVERGREKTRAKLRELGLDAEDLRALL